MIKKKSNSKNKIPFPLKSLGVAIGIIYIGNILLGILYFVVIMALSALFPESIGVYHMQSLDQLTIESFRQFATYQQFSGLFSGMFLLLIAFVNGLAGWYVIKKSKSNAWYYAVIPSILVLGLGLLPELLHFRYPLFGQVLSVPMRFLWDPFLFIIPILASLIGGLIALHVSLRIK